MASLTNKEETALCVQVNIWMLNPKIGVPHPPKWMVVHKGRPYFLMDDLGGKNPYFWFNTHYAFID